MFLLYTGNLNFTENTQMTIYLVLHFSLQNAMFFPRYACNGHWILNLNKHNLFLVCRRGFFSKSVLLNPVACATTFGSVRIVTFSDHTMLWFLSVCSSECGRSSAECAGVAGAVPGARPAGLAPLHRRVHPGHLPPHPPQGHHRPALYQAAADDPRLWRMHWADLRQRVCSSHHYHGVSAYWEWG